MLNNLLTYLIFSLSISFIWSFTEIFMPVRNFVAKIPYIRRPLLCPECCSFWVGLLVAFIFNPFLNQIGFISYILLGASTHLFACFLYKIYFKLI
jgi:hypothetical protein